VHARDIHSALPRRHERDRHAHLHEELRIRVVKMWVSYQIALAAVMGTAASAAVSAPLRAELQKQYEAAARSFVRRDVAGLMSLTAPDMTSRRPDGHVW